MNKDILRQFATIFTFILTIVVNGLANALPLNGQTAAAISDRFPVFFVPAGYAFSIWSLIFLLLLSFTIYQALPSQRENAALRRIGYLPALSGVLNSVWVFLWHYEQWVLALAVMVALLATLIAIYLRLDVGRAQVSRAVRWLVHLPFSVYLGWITVASVANATILLYIAEWNGFGISPEAWAAIMLAVGAVIAITMILTRRDVAYTLVILWAYVGIVVKQSGTPVVAAVAGIAAAVVALVLIISLFRGRPKMEAGTPKPA